METFTYAGVFGATLSGYRTKRNADEGFALEISAKFGLDTYRRFVVQCRYQWEKCVMDLKTVLAIPSAIAVTGGILFGANEYVAKDKDLQLVSYRLEQKIRSDRMQVIQERMWKIEDRFRGKQEHEWPPGALDTYRRLEIELEKLEKEERR